MSDQLPGGLKVLQEKPYLIAEAADADAFLGALSPISGFGADRAHRSLLYRGERQSSWNLVPASRRKSSWPPQVWGVSNEDTWRSRLASEAVSLLGFCNVAARQGLAIPNQMTIRRRLSPDMFEFFSGNVATISGWPHIEMVPALALAQHHGLQTCLLDFTWDPYIATYFAARDWLEESGTTVGHLCVWIVEDNSLTMDLKSRNHPVQLLVPPPSDNHTLQAQEGLFMWKALSMNEIGDPAREYEVGDGFETFLSAEGSECLVRKILLGTQEAKRLLHHVIKLGYDSGRLFPTFEGAVRALKESMAAGIGPRMW